MAHYKVTAENLAALRARAAETADMIDRYPVTGPDDPHAARVKKWAAGMRRDVKEADRIERVLATR